MSDTEIIGELRQIKFAAQFLKGEDVPAMVDALIARIREPVPPEWPRPTPDRLPTYLRLHNDA